MAQLAQIGYENGVNKIFHQRYILHAHLSIPIPVSVLCAHLTHVLEQSPGRCEISVCTCTPDYQSPVKLSLPLSLYSHRKYTHMGTLTQHTTHNTHKHTHTHTTVSILSLSLCVCEGKVLGTSQIFLSSTFQPCLSPYLSLSCVHT